MESPSRPFHFPQSLHFGSAGDCLLFGLVIVVHTWLIIEQRLLSVLAIVSASYCLRAYCPVSSEARTIVSIVSAMLYCLARTVV
jgi:hypothetical protein